MGIVSFVTDLPGQIGLTPRRPKLVTTDALNVVEGAGYLNNASKQTGQNLLPTDIIDCVYSYTPATNSGTDIELTVAITNGTITLSPLIGTLPVTVVQTNQVNQMAAGADLALDKGTGTVAAGAVTVNHQAGVITTTSLTTAAGATATFTLTNSFITASSVITPSIMGGTNTTPGVDVSATAGAGTSTVTLTNTAATAALNGTVIVGFVVS